MNTSNGTGWKKISINILKRTIKRSRLEQYIRMQQPTDKHIMIDWIMRHPRRRIAVQATHAREARRPNIELTCNPSLAWFVRHYQSTNHDRPDCQVELVVLQVPASRSSEPWTARTIFLYFPNLFLVFKLFLLIIHYSSFLGLLFISLFL